ncbi:MAG: hypothetical protein J6J65_08235, partial [Opitutales bacterium]|nr:hypothetical protein [Opitutales bacterium]
AKRPMYSGKTLSIQKYSFPSKHLNCGETMPEFSARYEIAFSARVCVVVGWGNLWQFPLYAGVAKYSRERFRLKKRKNADKTRRFFGGRGGG